MPTDPSVLAAMRNLATSLSADEPTGISLERLTVTAVSVFSAIDVASISILTSDGALQTVGATDPIAVTADELQYRFREGPCYDAVTEEATFVAGDLVNDRRWPLFAPQAAALGLRAQLGLDLHPPSGTKAALNLYARRPTTFGTIIDDAQTFATQAALILGFTRTSGQFQEALESRSIIGEAIGIVMERYGLDEERAFNFLVRTSSQTNTKLRKVAEELVDGTNRRADAD